MTDKTAMPTKDAVTLAQALGRIRSAKDDVMAAPPCRYGSLVLTKLAEADLFLEKWLR